MAKAKSQSARSLFLSGSWEKLRTWELAPWIPIYVLYYSIKGLIQKQVTILTASLAFVTALSVVPLLSVAVSVLAAYGDFDQRESPLEMYIQQLFPSAASEIANYLKEFATTSAAEVAGIGAIAFFVIGFFLFMAIERAFNVIWTSERQRPWLQKGMAFITLMTFGPVLLSLSFGWSSVAQIQLAQFGVDTQVIDRLLPFLVAFLFFTAMNHFLPTAKVRWWSSLLAGAFTATVFEFGKWGFNLYVTEVILVPYNQVYGAFGLFPLFLIWLYVIWIIVLFGASLAYTSQNLRTIVSVESASERAGGRHKENVFSPLIGLELYAPIARAFKSGDGRVSETDLVTSTGYPETVVRGVVTRLATVGALDVVEDEAGERRLLPSKQLDDIQLLPIVDNFFDFETAPNSLPMARLLEGYRAVTLEVLRAESALALIPQDSELSKKYADAQPWDPIPPSSLGQPSSSAWQEPPADADPLESPPVVDELSQDEDKPTLDAQSRNRPLNRARGLSERARQLAKGSDSIPEMEKETTRPVGQDEEILEPEEIRIHTQDILVEASDLGDEPDDGDLTGSEVLPTDLGRSGASGAAEDSRLGGGPKKKKKKESSIEIDIKGMWDDFEVDNYDEILAAASDELRRTEELSIDDVEEAELGAEKSVPPPMPTDDPSKDKK